MAMPNIAVMAEQWEETAFLIDENITIGSIAVLSELSIFFVYKQQSDPNKVLDEMVLG